MPQLEGLISGLTLRGLLQVASSQERDSDLGGDHAQAKDQAGAGQVGLMESPAG